jgi:hypothetical protein
MNMFCENWVVEQGLINKLFYDDEVKMKRNPIDPPLVTTFDESPWQQRDEI